VRKGRDEVGGGKGGEQARREVREILHFGKVNFLYERGKGFTKRMMKGGKDWVWPTPYILPLE